MPARPGGNISKRAVAVVVEENPRLFVVAAEVLAVHLRVNVAVRDQNRSGQPSLSMSKNIVPQPDIACRGRVRRRRWRQ